MTLATAALLVAQTAAQPQMDRIAWAQVVMAVAMAVTTLVILGIGAAVLFLALALRRVARRLEEQVRALVPKTEPLVAAGNRIAADATELSGAVKVRVQEVLETVQDLNGRLRALSTETEERVREFGAVLEVVQGEARELLLDAAATARGVHTTAEMLQAPRPREAPAHVATSEPE